MDTSNHDTADKLSAVRKHYEIIGKLGEGSFG
jgi:hypothetical protein